MCSFVKFICNYLKILFLLVNRRKLFYVILVSFCLQMNMLLPLNFKLHIFRFLREGERVNMLNARGSLMLWIKVNLGKSRVLFVEGEFIFDAVDKLIFDLFFHLSLRLYKEMKAD